MLELLLRAGANPSVRSKEGLRPFDLAIMYQHLRHQALLKNATVSFGRSKGRPPGQGRECPIGSIPGGKRIPRYPLRSGLTATSDPFAALVRSSQKFSTYFCEMPAMEK